MSFFRERRVKQPRGRYHCDICGHPITGEHLYLSGLCCGDFSTMRAHIACERKQRPRCNDCYDRESCTFDVKECFAMQNEQERAGDE